ncbi:MAG: hypothetical protein L6R35_002660 [Caloplaca aegaea]|nr:MAG: hypothetical protein L6R35_002660 [Caloplaca aegaea]
MKPLQKVVTAQDVQSSLYYIHADSEDDERIRRSIDSTESDIPEDPFTTPNANQPVQSSPAPKDLNSATTERQLNRIPTAIPNNHRAGQYGPAMTQLVRKPVSSNSEQCLDDGPFRFNPPRTYEMGPRAMHRHLHSDNNPGSEPPSDMERPMPRRWSEQSPIPHLTLPPRSQVSERRQNLAHDSRHDGYENADAATRIDQGIGSPGPHRSVRQSARSANDGFSLTLIRRYDRSQWNIGKIFSLREEADFWDRQCNSRQVGLTIQISTPGYLRFYDLYHQEAPDAPNQAFERRLTKLRRRSRDLSSIEKNGNSTNNRKSRMSIDFRRLSTPCVEEKSEAMNSTYTDKRESLNIKGYGFYSPWNGTCEFSQGISGNVLKCKHTAPTEGSQAVKMSELRFNLPASGNLAAVSPRQRSSPEKPKNRKRTSYFSHTSESEPAPNKGSDQGSSEVHDTNDRLDLSLGQEHAGGGFGGKQAKLGKLIIEPEGLKMLDLLVAANMGLWWKVYEKSA